MWVMKYAMTLDGKVAAYTGASRWITGEAARQRVHRDRHRYRGILAGVGTVLADDPLLTCRMPGGRNPVRVICDTHLRTPLKSRVVRTAAQAETIFATCVADPRRIAPYTDAGCQVWTLPEQGRPGAGIRPDGPAGRRRRSTGVLLEGGGTLNWAMLEAGLVQRVQAYIAPKLLGGAGGEVPGGGPGRGGAGPGRPPEKHDGHRPGGGFSAGRRRGRGCLRGLIEEVGTLRDVRRGAPPRRCSSIRAEAVLSDLKTGDSVAVNGVCLTVTGVEPHGFTADVMHETTFKPLRAGGLGAREPGQSGAGHGGKRPVRGPYRPPATSTAPRLIVQVAARDDNARVVYGAGRPAFIAVYRGKGLRRDRRQSP